MSFSLLLSISLYIRSFPQPPSISLHPSSFSLSLSLYICLSVCLYVCCLPLYLSLYLSPSLFHPSTVSLFINIMHQTFDVLQHSAMHCFLSATHLTCTVDATPGDSHQVDIRKTRHTPRREGQQQHHKNMHRVSFVPCR